MIHYETSTELKRKHHISFLYIQCRPPKVGLFIHNPLIYFGSHEDFKRTPLDGRIFWTFLLVPHLFIGLYFFIIQYNHLIRLKNSNLNFIKSLF